MNKIIVFFVSFIYIFFIIKQIRFVNSGDIFMVGLFSLLISSFNMFLIRKIVLGNIFDRIGYVFGAFLASILAMYI